MDLKTVAVDGLKSASKVFLNDLNALPEEAFTQSFGGATRSVADIVYEVNLVNDHVGMVLRAEEPFEWPSSGQIKAPPELATIEAVIEAFRASSARIVATAEALSLADFEGTVETERGPRTRFERCQFMAIHMWYHCGQLNFVQLLRGDADWHWG